MRKFLINAVVMAVLLLISFGLVSCTNHGNEDSISTLESTSSEISSDDYEEINIRYEKYQPYVEKVNVMSDRPLVEEEWFASLEYYEKDEYSLPKAKEYVEFEFMKKTYTANYSSSRSEALGKNMYRLEYKTDGMDKFVFNETGCIIVYTTAKSQKIRSEVTADTQKTPDEIENIVNDYITEIYGTQNIDFVISISGPHNMPSDWGDVYSAYIVYKVDGYSIDEFLNLVFALDGTLLSMSSNNLGYFVAKNVPDDFGNDKAVEIISKMLAEDKQNFEACNYSLTILEDGRLGLEVLVKLFADDRDNMFNVIIPLE